MQAVVDAHGPWTPHNIEVAPGVFTRGSGVPGSSAPRVAHVARLISDLCPSAFEALRILDLGSLEGEITIELARRGTTTVGIEVREPHVARARFAAEALGVEGASFVQDDVRTLSAERYGSFDVVLCRGILYHLDWPDSFELLKSAWRTSVVGSCSSTLRSRSDPKRRG
jgi:2-polyprenyl-3-methyl-5-hydroxy-6-metoxy-1,4-benzoquinol methylase